jgi:hypothetical protein
MKMRPFELDWTAKMMDAVIPAGVEKDFPKSASETGAVKVLEELVAYTPFITALGLRASVWFIEILGPLFAGRLRRFSRLDPGGREQVLAALYKSRVYFIRQMVLLIKMTACFGWGADPETRRGIGVTDPPRFVSRSKS